MHWRPVAVVVSLAAASTLPEAPACAAATILVAAVVLPAALPLVSDRYLNERVRRRPSMLRCGAAVRHGHFLLEGALLRSLEIFFFEKDTQ